MIMNVLAVLAGIALAYFCGDRSGKKNKGVIDAEYKEKEDGGETGSPERSDPDA